VLRADEKRYRRRGAQPFTRSSRSACLLAVDAVYRVNLRLSRPGQRITDFD